MKKYLLVAVLAIFGYSAQAQLVQSTMLNIQKEKRTTWYLRVGASFNNPAGPATGDDGVFYNMSDEEKDDYSIGNKLGYDLAIGFQRSIGGSGLYWGQEYGFGSRGAQVSFKGEYDEYKSSLMAHNVKIAPFILGYRIGLTDMISIDPHVGCFLSYDYFGKGKMEEDGEEDDNMDLSEINDEYGYQSFDGGLQVGVGVWYGRLNLDLTYQRGFVSVCDCDDFNNKAVYSSNFMVRLGVSF